MRTRLIHFLFYTWILFYSLLAFPVLYSYGNLDAVDTFFFGYSGSTESGLNTVNVKDLKTYQQVFLYVIPIITNLIFINAIRIRRAMTQAGSARTRLDNLPNEKTGGSTRRTKAQDIVVHRPPTNPKPKRATTITFDDPATQPSSPTRDKRQEPEPAAADNDDKDQDKQTGLRAKTVGKPDAIKPVERTISRRRSRHRSSYAEGSVLHAAKSIGKVATSAFVLGDTRAPRPRSRSRSRSLTRQQTLDLPILSRQVTIGRNSNFYNVSEMDRERLGGIEYHTLKLLLKFIFSYFFGLHLLGVATSKVIPKNSQTRETIQFLLDYPRRYYTLLFPSRPTWVLFGIVFALSFIDVVLIIYLDLDNPTVADLPIGPRILSALFQAASARHTGTSTLNLAAINPAVQFSLLTIIYIAVFPIAISIRASNVYEERTVGIYTSYVIYIFFGAFLIYIAESRRIIDLTEPSFSAFPILFEVTSVYGPSGNTSISGHFTPFSKIVIYAIIIRGRHRGLPYTLDRAINLPIDDVVINASQDREAGLSSPTGD
ncbi:cation transport protein-domain-containing protein [Plectosphaerella cucumerina]|uniref:Cation transport protein-domain-containing protein n=1 Tax=Plectosphaerella cucumerina TaxID=40658 RepID=A0A8K0TFM0_9PEZI|nr:cation transport protein-domain-containing protein [Plectosphaerella cucumerina]